MYSTIDEPITVSLDSLALCFAIYFAAAVSLDIPEAQETLSEGNYMILLWLKASLEQAFAHGDFLDRPTVTGLHVLTIYLVCSILALCSAFQVK